MTPQPPMNDATAGKNPPKEQTWPCAKCGKPMTKAQGGTVFTHCEECWDDKPTEAPNVTEADERFTTRLAIMTATKPTTGAESRGEMIAVNAALLRLFKGEYRLSSDRHKDALFVQGYIDCSTDARAEACRAAVAEAVKPLVEALEAIKKFYSRSPDCYAEAVSTDALRDHATKQGKGEA